ncbi:MAG: DUF58 domain-containing protein [Anaerolineae bacterium]|jgi:uncharacterized protein (DUF58 family)
MGRSLIVLLLWLFLLIGAIGTGRALFYNLWYLLTVLLASSYLWAWSGIRWVRVQRLTRTARSQVSKMAEERLVVHNRGWIPKLWLEVRDHSTLPGHRISRVIHSLGARKKFAWTVKTRCTQRGRFTLGPLSLTSGDPFGLFTMSRQLVEPRLRTFIVYPATVDVPAFAPLVGYLPGGDAMRRRTSYVTTNVAGVRDYAPGDSFNRIHWPSTARTGRLISKEFELDPTTDVWLFLDLDRSVHVESPWASFPDQHRLRLPWEYSTRLELLPSTVEYAVTIVASLAKHFIARDRAVGLVAYCLRREIIPADRGERQLTKILETLAVLQAEGGIPFREVIAAEGAHLSRNTTVILVTSATHQGWITAAHNMNQRGIRTVAVVIESHSFGHVHSNEGAITELAVSGIPAYLVREGDDLAEALAQPQAQTVASIGYQLG